jgi:hypothetical protein
VSIAADGLGAVRIASGNDDRMDGREVSGIALLYAADKTVAANADVHRAVVQTAVAGISVGAVITCFVSFHDTVSAVFTFIATARRAAITRLGVAVITVFDVGPQVSVTAGRDTTIV